MIIQANESNEIIGYSIVGCIEDAIKIDDKIVPDSFFESFKSGYYLYQNNEIVINPNYKEPTVEIPEAPEQPEPSKEWQAINMLALQVAQLKSKNGGA